jgi:hypothetical protein
MGAAFDGHGDWLTGWGGAWGQCSPRGGDGGAKRGPEASGRWLSSWRQISKGERQWWRGHEVREPLEGSLGILAVTPQFQEDKTEASERVPRMFKSHV